MKKLISVLIVLLTIVGVNAQSIKGFKMGHNNSAPQLLSNGSAISYVHFSNSINGPFVSPDTILTTDSLFIKLDVTPLGNVSVEFWVDVNANGVIDGGDMQVGSDSYTDNSVTPPAIDLDPTQGVIVAFLKPDQMPSMQIVVKATENTTTVNGVIVFENKPAPYTLSGTVYSSNGYGLNGAWIFAMKDSISVGDVADNNGFYSIPLDTGTYYVRIMDQSGMHNSFDTVIVLTNSVSQDFYLQSLNSYIRGYVRDENSIPLRNIGVYNQNGGSNIRTDSLGQYKMLVPAGSSNIGLNPNDLLPRYLNPQSHNYTIGTNDSIVNNQVSNFTCYTANDSITGTVHIQGSSSSGMFLINGWDQQNNSNTQTVSNPLTGYYSLPAHQSLTMPIYNVNISDWSSSNPWPAGMYPDTSYWNVSPGASNVNFTFVSAETSLVEPFLGNYVYPSFSVWDTYQYGQPTGPKSELQCLNDRLKVVSSSQSGLSGYGLLTRKPLQLNDREYRVYIDHTQLGNENSVYMLLSNRQINWQHFYNADNWLMLSFSKQPSGGWRLQKSVDRNITQLWGDPDTTGGHILWQFNSDASVLTLTINGVVKYSGPWGSQFSIAYVHLFEMNFYPNTPTPVYFDEFFVGAVGSTGVRDIGGELPKLFNLEQNYPNPFNPATVIRYQIPEASVVTLKVYDVLGREVSTLVNEEQKPGNYEAVFDASKISSGVYYYRINIVSVNSGKSVYQTIKKALVVK
jgi:hypothetical protein